MIHQQSAGLSPMTRRQLLACVGCGLTSLGRAQDADIKLRIGEINLELAPRRVVKTLAYNGQVPGPLLRAVQGRPITVDVWNETKEDDMVHWHGLHIPSDVDGSHEEGTPPVPAQGHRRYVFTPGPTGTRWYHSHGHAGRNLHKTTYSGQFGMFVVESGNDPGRYDLEVPVLLHEWEPHFSEEGDVDFRLFSVNGKMLGAGEPIRVRQSQRVLFRMLNASATLHHRLALSGHTFNVMALDGNAVSNSQPVPVVDLSPGERVDAIVEMNRPGVWIFGELRDRQRGAGMGIVVEYVGEKGPPRWVAPPAFDWDYTIFGGQQTPPEPDGRIPLVIRQQAGGHQWTINGKSFPHTAPMVVSAGRRYRLVFDNQSAEAHPLHLHRHTFEITRFAQKPTSGVFKDVVVVPAWRQVEVDVVTANPGPTLFHCHQQFHMDFGFMAMMQYSV